MLSIVGLVIGGIWIAAANMHERMKIQRTIEQVTSIVECARGRLSPSDFGDVGFKLLLLECFPPDVRLRPEFGYLVGGVATEFAASPVSSIVMPGLPAGSLRFAFFGPTNNTSSMVGTFPPGACNRLIQALANAFGSSGEYLMQISSIAGTFTPEQFSFAAVPDKCGAGNFAFLVFRIPRQ